MHADQTTGLFAGRSCLSSENKECTQRNVLEDLFREGFLPDKGWSQGLPPLESNRASYPRLRNTSPVRISEVVPFRPSLRAELRTAARSRCTRALRYAGQAEIELELAGGAHPGV